MTPVDEMAACKGELFKKLMRVDALSDFAGMMRAGASIEARRAAQPGLPDDARRDLLASVRFCHDFADEAEAALTAFRAAATAQGEGGFRQ